MYLITLCLETVATHGVDNEAAGRLLQEPPAATQLVGKSKRSGGEDAEDNKANISVVDNATKMREFYIKIIIT